MKVPRIFFLLISQLEVCQEGGYLEDIEGSLPETWMTGSMVISDVMNDVLLPQGRYPENFVPISLLEVCQEGGGQEGGTWRTLGVPEGRLGGQGHPQCLG